MVDQAFSYTDKFETPLLWLTNLLVMYQGMEWELSNWAHLRIDQHTPIEMTGTLPNGQKAVFKLAKPSDLTDVQLYAMRALIGEHNTRLPYFKQHGYEYSVVRFKQSGKYCDESEVTVTAGPTMYEAFPAVKAQLGDLLKPYFTTVVTPKGHPHGYPFVIPATERG